MNNNLTEQEQNALLNRYAKIAVSYDLEKEIVNVEKGDLNKLKEKYIDLLKNLSECTYDEGTEVLSKFGLGG